MSKKILEVVWIDEKIVRVKLEATKRRKMWVKVEKETPANPICDPSICPLYYDCSKMKSPLVQYHSFAIFCNNLFSDYPELKEKLGVKCLNQVVPIKKRRP